MKTICKIIFFLVFFLFLFAFLPGCKSNTVITTNEFLQTNYDYQCLDGTKTFTEIIICYQTQDQAEKMQNNITNELIERNIKK